MSCGMGFHQNYIQVLVVKWCCVMMCVPFNSFLDCPVVLNNASCVPYIAISLHIHTVYVYSTTYISSWVQYAFGMNA